MAAEYLEILVGKFNAITLARFDDQSTFPHARSPIWAVGAVEQTYSAGGDATQDEASVSIGVDSCKGHVPQVAGLACDVCGNAGPVDPKSRIDLPLDSDWSIVERDLDERHAPIRWRRGWRDVRYPRIPEVGCVRIQTFQRDQNTLARQQAGTDYHFQGAVYRSWSIPWEPGKECLDTAFVGIYAHVFGSEEEARAFLADEDLLLAWESADKYPSYELDTSTPGVLTVRQTYGDSECGTSRAYCRWIAVGRFAIDTCVGTSDTNEAEVWGIVDHSNQVVAQKLAGAGIE